MTTVVSHVTSVREAGILYSLNKAYQGLKFLFDPAMEGSPYDTNNKTSFRLVEKEKEIHQPRMIRRNRFSF